VPLGAILQRFFSLGIISFCCVIFVHIANRVGFRCTLRNSMRLNMAFFDVYNVVLPVFSKSVILIQIILNNYRCMLRILQLLYSSEVSTYRNTPNIYMGLKVRQFSKYGNVRAKYSRVLTQR
jgi:hypothetical protein